jgi:ABC-2 type transport system ATP-binding protein
VTGLRKTIPDKKNGPKVVLDGVDLAAAPGTVLALLGPNGAAKTTAVQILTTYLRADAGTVLVDGADVAKDPDKVRAAIGVTGQFSAVDGLLTGEENLLLMADLAHLPKARGRQIAAELLEKFDLTDAAKKVASVYSGGMRRRLDLAMTLVAAPRIIFLDGQAPRARQGNTVWTRVPGAPCGRSSRSWSAAARPSSSPRSTWRRPTSSRTGSRSWTTAGSLPRAPRPSSSGWCREAGWRSSSPALTVRLP